MQILDPTLSTAKLETNSIDLLITYIINTNIISVVHSIIDFCLNSYYDTVSFYIKLLIYTCTSTEAPFFNNLSQHSLWPYFDATCKGV